MTERPAMSGRTLVTGASGFIGTHLLADLRAAGADVVAWTRSMGDLRDHAAVRSALDQVRPDRIVHLAATPPGDANAPWSAVADEQKMLAHLAYAMAGHCQLIYTGSMAEYGRAGTFAEGDRCAPDTAYGSAKYACTSLAIALRELIGADIRVARLFGVYGPGEGRTRLLPNLIRRLANGDPVQLSDGDQVRDFIHVADVCDAICALAVANDPDIAIVNVGTGVGVSVRQLCESVAGVLNADPALLEFGALPRRTIDQDRLVANTDRLATIMPIPSQRWSEPAKAAACVAEFMALDPAGRADCPTV